MQKIRTRSNYQKYRGIARKIFSFKVKKKKALKLQRTMSKRKAMMSETFYNCVVIFFISYLRLPKGSYKVVLSFFE